MEFGMRVLAIEHIRGSVYILCEWHDAGGPTYRVFKEELRFDEGTRFPVSVLEKIPHTSFENIDETDLGA